MLLLSPKRVISSIGVPAACLMFVAAALLPPLSSPARAQASGMAGIGETDTSTVRATVKAIDMKTRTLTLVGPQGETKTLKVGEQVQNLAQVKPGDTVVARYYGFRRLRAGTSGNEASGRYPGRRRCAGGAGRDAGGRRRKQDRGHRPGRRRKSGVAHDLARRSRRRRDPHHRRHGPTSSGDDAR